MPRKIGGRCPGCGRELIGYVEEGATTPKFFCQNTGCPRFMRHTSPTFMPRRVDTPFRPRQF